MHLTYKNHSIKMSPFDHHNSADALLPSLTFPSVFLLQPLLRWDGSQRSALVPK